MEKTFNRIVALTAAVAAAAVFLYGCKSPLVSVIEEEVAVAVTPPSVESVFPESGATDVAVSTNYISIDFTKSINASTVTSSTITVTDASGTKVNGSWAVSGTTATFTPSGSLSYSSTYLITVTTGLQDTDGNPMDNTYTWSFTTGLAPDSTRPVIHGVTVNSGAAWSNSLTITLDIDASDNNDTESTTSIAQMNINNTGWQSYNPAASFTLSPGEGARTVNINIKDGSGNESGSYAAAINIDTVAPEISNFLINGGASATNVNTIDLDVFVADENSSGPDQFRYRLQGGDWSAFQDLTIDSGTGTASVIGLLISTSLGESQVVEVQASDNAGNYSETAEATILFEQTPPSVIDVSWDDETVFPYNGSLLRITFDEEMSPASFTESRYLLTRVSDSAAISGMVGITSTGTGTNDIAELWGFELSPNTQYRVTLKTTVEDIAGNALGGDDKVWYFSTGDATDTTPPEGDVALTQTYGLVRTLPSGSTATDSATIELDFSGIDDDYNIEYGIKIWGDNDGMHAGEESFEQDAGWVSWPSNDKLDWHLSTDSGTKYILYKFMDSAGNETASPQQMRIILDNNEEPVISSVSINNGDGYTNAADRKVSLSIAASDEYAGLKDIMISNNSSFTGASWQTYEPTIDEWTLDDVDGERFIYIKVRDNLDIESDGGSYYTSGANPPSIILDRTDPVINWNTALILVSDEAQLLEGSGGSDYYQTSSDVASYFWEKISGTGDIYFNESDGFDAENDGIDDQEPYIWATDEETYFLNLTVTDNAGNSSSSSIPFEWDVTAPGNVSNLDAADYDTSGQPTWTWDEVSDTDFYRTSFVSDFTTYVDVYTNSYSPGQPLPDGVNTLYVRAQDNAGNYSSSLNDSVHVDTTFPTITVASGGWSYIENIANDGTLEIDFSSAATGNGEAADGGSNPSGIASYAWSKYSGTGNLTFSDPSAQTTTVTADADGNYQIRLAVTDTAGNTAAVYLSLLSDVTAPGTPTITGMSQTPNLQPTWYWTSGGGGSGTFIYRLYDEGASSIESGPVQDDATYFMPGSPLTNDNSYTMYVKEVDAAGNESAEDSFTTYANTSLTTPPQVTIGDGEPALRTIDTMTWNILTGAGGFATKYRYYFDGSGSWTTVDAGLSNNSMSPTQITRTGLSDGTRSVTVQEYFNGYWHDGVDSATGYDPEDLTAVHSVTVDTDPPDDPILSGPGYTTGDTDRQATNDNTPTWSWSTGGNGGYGKYQYKVTRTEDADGTADGSIIVDWTDDSSATSYTPSTLSDGTYQLEVKERDAAGNYSDISHLKLTVDTEAPDLDSVSIYSFYHHPDDTTSTYTNNVYVGLNLTGDISSELNSEYSRPVQINLYDYNEHIYGDYISPWNENNTSAETIYLNLPSTNGTRYVYARLRDEAGNITSFYNDTIILDTVDPAVTFNINGGAAYTPSLSSKLNLTASDNISGAEDLEVRTRYEGVYGDYRSFSTTMSSDFEFTDAAGSKTAYVQFRDAAGNTTSLISDSITLQVPEPRYAWKGYYTTGASRVYYDAVTEPDGANTTRYYVYYTDDPTVDPNGGDPVTSLSYTTSTDYKYVAGLPKGELLYFFVRAYNYDTGGYGPYSSTSVLGYSSNVTVVYDDDDATDIALAQEIKALLQDDQDILSYAYVGGTMPDFTVTLLPEDLIPNTYDEAEPFHYRIYGDPTILTPGTSLGSWTYKSRNIASAYRGVIAMGSAGGSFLYRVDYNWDNWGMSGYRPEDIDSGNQMTLASATNAKSRSASTSESIWLGPLYHTTLYSYPESSYTVSMFSSATSRRGVYRAGGSAPSGGAIYAGDLDSTAHFPVVRQGEYLFFGYEDVPNATSTGEVFFINLVNKMSAY